jgi:polysaccharide export outer membrane protein
MTEVAAYPAQLSMRYFRQLPYRCKWSKKMLYLISIPALTAILTFSQSMVAAEDLKSEGPPRTVEERDESPGQYGFSELPGSALAGSGSMILDEEDYRIGPADELQIEIFQIDELSGVEKVNSRGYIKMPLIGSVKVAGLTREQAENLIEELYAVDYLQDPQVNIDISDYASQQVTLLGAVGAPGVYPLKGRTTLMQALAMGGGTERLADEESIVVFRSDASGAVIGYIVNLELIKIGKKTDPQVLGNDRIVVPESGSKSFVKGLTDTLRGFVGFRVY